jgi:NodT family efflux transporter outer membrane factor (OMF) lipoprotein
MRKRLIKVARRPLWIAAAVSSTLVGCALGPTHVAPDATKHVNATQWHAPVASSRAPVSVAEFWQRWGDPSLARLIEGATKNATTMELAYARIAQARAGVRIAGSSLALGATAIGSGTRGDQGQGAASVFSGAVQAAWEIDLFGANQRTREAASARLQARERDLIDMHLSLIADVATVYVNLRVNEALLTGFERDAASRAETERLTQLKAKAGFEAPANAALATAAAAEAKTRVLAQRAEIDLGIKTLVALTAISEPEIRVVLQPRFAQLASPPELAVPTIPADILARRADLAALERELAAATAEIGAAEADRYPKLSLTGSIGYSATRAFGGTADGLTWGFGPSVSVPLFDAGRRAANVDLAKARHLELSANYRAAALRAVQEVEEALTRIDSVGKREGDQRTSLANYEAFEKAAQTRLNAGVGSVLELQEARRAVLGAQVNMLGLERERLTAWISLYRAVGGDWNAAAMAAKSSAQK